MSREVIILAGQSNMVGSNTIPNPAPCYTNDDRIWVKTQPWYPSESSPIDPSNPGSGAWVQSMADPISGYPGSGVSPGKAMADRYITLRDDPELEIGLVPCAMGATSIDWKSSSYPASWDRTLFWTQPWPHLICRALDAQSWGTIKCLVWYQGESDTDPFPHPAFMRSTLDLFERFRQRIGIYDLPIIYTKLGANPNSSNYPYWSSVQSFQEWGSTCDPKIKMVTASDNSVINDGLGVHKTAAANITLGHQYADMLVTM